MTTNELMTGIQTARTSWHEEHQVLGAEGGRIDLAVFDGSIQYANGEIARFAGVESIEMSDVEEPFAGSIVVLLKDGSVSHQTFDGRVTFREETGRIGGIGRWEFLSGTGRFSGLRGGGPLRWTIEDGLWRAEFGTDEDG